MTDLVTPVSLFRYEALENFFKQKNDDFERIPLLAIGCFFLIVNKIQSLASFEWGHVADFGKIGETMSNLTDYWELVDFLNGGYTSFTLAWTVYTTADLASEKGKSQALEVTKKAILCAGKAFSNFVNFIGMMVTASALKGLNIHKWKMIGSAFGIVYFTQALYENLTKEATDPDDIKQVKDAAKDTYRAQHARKVFYNNLITASILAIKVISLCGAVQALYGASSIVKFIADCKGDLFFSSFVGVTTGVIGSHLYGEQMKSFKQLNKAS